jgi:HAMP domain-containing protein
VRVTPRRSRERFCLGSDVQGSRPTFAAWSNLTVLAFAVTGAMLAAALDVREAPVLVVVIGCGLVLFFAVPLTVGALFSPSLQPLRDLAEGTERVASGDYSQRLPVVQDDDIGALAASFNRMQAGLAERQRLHAAFGTYVVPALAARLLEQGDDVFTGERRQVTVMFVDIRDFTRSPRQTLPRTPSRASTRCSRSSYQPSSTPVGTSTSSSATASSGSAVMHGCGTGTSVL